ncbi:MAG: hypothetical protein KGQ59_11025, partial [Bdellovibrionales bacterium]|nr:hypothetical protein [Bdellovibrionales bacterium]
GVGTLFGLWKAWRLDESPLKRTAQIFFILTWFLPFQHARFSAEALSGAVFFTAVAVIAIEQDKPYRLLSWLLSGFLLGISFQFRYQVGFLIVGLLAWILIRKNPGSRRLSHLFIGLFLALGVGALADHWLYGEWSLTPWNFFRVNLIEGKAAQFGVSPWWDYFRLLFLNLFLPPLSLAYLYLFFVGLGSKRAEPLLWSIVPFFVVHCLIGHKELRFLYPLASAFPLVLVLAAEEAGAKSNVVTRWISGKIFSIISIFLLLLYSLKPARLIEVTNKKLALISIQDSLCIYSDATPAHYQHGIPTEFTRIRNAKYFVLPDGLNVQGCRKVLFWRGVSQAGQVERRFPGSRLLHKPVPEFLLRFNFNGWLNRVQYVELWELP